MCQTFTGAFVIKRCLYFFWEGDFCDAVHFCFLVYLLSPISPLEDTTDRNNSTLFQSLQIINLFKSQSFFLEEKSLRKTLLWLILITSMAKDIAS